MSSFFYDMLIFFALWLLGITLYLYGLKIIDSLYFLFMHGKFNRTHKNLIFGDAPSVQQRVHIQYIYICICWRQWKSNHFKFFLSEPALIEPCGYISPHYMPHEVSFKIVCPTEEEYDMLMSSLSVKCSHVRIGGKKGMSWARQGTKQGWKIGQLIQSMGPVRVEVHSFVQNTSKRALIIFLGTFFFIPHMALLSL